MKKRVLCFGDSNVFGTNHTGGARYEKRWPVVLQTLLGDNYEVVEEGLSGRALRTETPHRNGMEHLRVALESHRPLDVCIVMLGTTDSKIANRRDVDIFLGDVENALLLIAQFSAYRATSPAKVIWVLPPRIGDYTQSSRSEEYDEESVVWIEKMRTVMKMYLEDQSVSCINAEDLKVGNDGLHLLEESHQKLARMILDRVL